MKLEIKSYITIPPEKEELNKNQEYPGYIEMTHLEGLDVFNYEFGRSGGYPGGKVVFCVDGKPLPFNTEVFELYRFWYNLVLTLLPKDKSIEKLDHLIFYADDYVMDNFKIRIFYHKKTVEFHYKKQVFATFSLDEYKKAVLQGFLDFMWHTNLEFETITHDSLGDEIDYIDLREDLDSISELYGCRYIFLQFMKEIYKQKSYDLGKLINLNFDTSYYYSKLEYDLED
ncbi:hypothetical protein SFB93_11115 [Kurthia gibsonii]|uniref:hypothetical protein n=3 Tax=Caryophanaceae TaxID=186818 RepID=UPI000745EC60|nr:MULTISPECIES: hypothetical protein [Kurthia]AMA64205.1 hypothetical protein ASO14_167 [Kurthia sp. 11kri321]GED20528.1 hypothetical protein KGI01_22690 [Kurthia gibsonii]